MGLTVNAVLARAVAFEADDLLEAPAFLAEPNTDFDD